jgi:hypothetical protein
MRLRKVFRGALSVINALGRVIVLVMLIKLLTVFLGPIIGTIVGIVFLMLLFMFGQEEKGNA